MKVLGIDPGIASTGWGVIELKNGKLIPLSYDTISTKPAMEIQDRILLITQEIKKVIEYSAPDSVSIEDIFFLRNVSSAIPVAKVIGSVLYLTSLQQISFACYTPLQIKLALTGMGKANKQQVEHMVAFLLGMKPGKALNHTSDALAAAVCHIHTTQGLRGVGL